jgi:DNA-directed RNA polymerase specialized sigma24 family protein
VSVGGDRAVADHGFRDYVTARSETLLRMAYPLTRNQADAEDLLQAALAKTYQAWDRIQDPGHWTATCAVPW